MSRAGRKADDLWLFLNKRVFWQAQTKNCMAEAARDMECAGCCLNGWQRRDYAEWHHEAKKISKWFVLRPKPILRIGVKSILRIDTAALMNELTFDKLHSTK
jgi:hypothetical protein